MTIRDDYTAAGGVVTDDAGRVLVLDRPSRGEVRLPKGHVEPGESPRATARREVGEESGYVELDAGRDLGEQVVTFDYLGRRITRSERYFAFRLLGARRAERSAKDAAQFVARWLVPAAAIQALTFEVELEWVRRAVALDAATSGPSQA